MTYDVADSLEVVAAIIPMRHFPHGHVLRIVHPDMGHIHHGQSVSSAHLRQIELLAEQKHGIVDRAAAPEVGLCQDDERPMSGIDGARRVTLVSLATVEGVAVEGVEQREAVDHLQDPECPQRQAARSSGVTVPVLIARVYLWGYPSCVLVAVVVGQLREEVLLHRQVHVAHDGVVVDRHVDRLHQSSHGPEVARVVIVSVPGHEDVEPDLVFRFLQRLPQRCLVALQLLVGVVCHTE